MASVLSGDRQTIGDFLRQRRLSLQPDRFAALIKRRRHVDHLTQTDLAELAGVSVAVVAQVETGRYENINPALVLRLSRALQLDQDQERYLLNFLQPVPAPVAGHASPPQSNVTAGIRSVVDNAEPNPAVLINARFDILYWNLSATKLLGDFGAMPADKRNVLWSMFGVPEMRQVWVGWESNARNMVAGIKMIASFNPVYRPSINSLVAELCQADPDFRRFWAEEDPGMQPNMEKGYIHPRLGPMQLFQTVTEIMGSPDLSYILFTPGDKATEALFRQL
jgi:transcriptional regulator with XRE-family HTH domain